MKARLAFLSIALCLCLLAGWGVSRVEKPLQEEAPPEESQATTFCRVVQEEQGTLLLAEQGSTAVFTLTLGDQDMTLDGASFDPSVPGAYQALPGESLAGTTVLVTHSGGFQETWPLRFSNVTALAFSTEEFNDLCVRYLQVLEDLWAVDPGLNENITELGVDLSGTSLSYTERQAVAWAFGQAHGLPVIQGTYEELAEDGYLTPSLWATPMEREKRKRRCTSGRTGACSPSRKRTIRWGSACLLWGPGTRSRTMTACGLMPRSGAPRWELTISRTAPPSVPGATGEATP